MKRVSIYQVRQRQLYQLIGVATMIQGLGVAYSRNESDAKILKQLKRISNSAEKLEQLVRDAMLKNTCDAAAAKTHWARVAMKQQ